MKNRSVLAVAACLLATGLLNASAFGTTLVSLLLPPGASLAGRTSPLRLANTAPTPITLTLKGKTFNAEAPEKRPPPLKSISLQFDKNGAIFTRGLATCRPPWNPDVGWSPRCPEALVGHGEVEFEIQSPEEPTPLRTQSPLLIYNGAPHDGRPVLIYSVYSHVPAATTFITSGVIERAHGKFGTQTTIPIPKIVSGEGSLTAFQAKIGKTWTYRGRRVSLLSAHCPRGSLFAHAELEFVTGVSAAGEIEQACGQKAEA